MVSVCGKSPSWVTRDKGLRIMQHYMTDIDALDDIGEVLLYACRACLEQRVARMSYHVTPLFDEPTSPTTAVYAEGFSEEWLECYDRHDFRQSDPIPQRVLAHGELMTWQDAMQAGENSAANLAYFKAMRKYGLIHGFGLPLFGPRGRNAYASFDFGEPLSNALADRLANVRAVAQAAHQRVSVLLDKTVKAPVLSEREVEVLSWAARGKSVASIAAILNLSPDTVKTYSKRIYAKLDVTDRVGAVVKALKLGLVRL